VDQLAGGIGLALLAAAAVIERWRGERLRNTARFAMMFTGSALYLKLLVLLHPDKWLIDAVFHAHRLENVMAGNYFFTSIAPGGYTFPYPIALYVTALPLARIVTDHVLLLRLVAAAAEALSALFFYWMIVRGSGDRLAAAVAVAVLQLMPLGFGVLAAANLTNVYGQAVALIAMTLVTVAVVTSESPWPAIVTAGCRDVRGLPVAHEHVRDAGRHAGGLGLLLVVLGEPPTRRAGVRVLAMLLVASASRSRCTTRTSCRPTGPSGRASAGKWRARRPRRRRRRSCTNRAAHRSQLAPRRCRARPRPTTRGRSSCSGSSAWLDGGSASAIRSGSSSTAGCSRAWHFSRWACSLPSTFAITMRRCLLSPSWPLMPW
jgi:hypothetical protein